MHEVCQATIMIDSCFTIYNTRPSNYRICIDHCSRHHHTSSSNTRGLTYERERMDYTYHRRFGLT